MVKTFDHKSGDFVKVGSANIYYEFAGNPDKAVMIILHGGFGTFEDLNVITEDLGERFSLLGIDSRGHGRSNMGTEILSYSQLQSDVQQVLNHLGLKECSIIGFSDGGVVGYRLLAFAPFKINHLITIDSRWHYNNVGGARQALEGVTADGWKQKFPETFSKYQELNPEPDFGKLAAALKAMWLDPGPSGYPNETIKKYSGPLLIIRGDQDPLLSLRDVEELKKLIPGSAYLNVPFAGHAPFATQKEVILPAIHSFLQIAL